MKRVSDWLVELKEALPPEVQCIHMANHNVLWLDRFNGLGITIAGCPPGLPADNMPSIQNVLTALELLRFGGESGKVNGK